LKSHEAPAFVLHRAHEAQRGMNSLAVVEHLDVLEDFGASLFAADESSMMNQLVLEIAEEAFDDGVVVAIALAAHAGERTDRGDLGLIERADIGRTPVAVMHEAGHGLSSIDSHA